MLLRHGACLLQRQEELLAVYWVLASQKVFQRQYPGISPVPEAKVILPRAFYYSIQASGPGYKKANTIRDMLRCAVAIMHRQLLAKVKVS